jgi:hypothetical protein
VRSGQDVEERERERITREIEEDEKLGRVGTRTRKSRASLTLTTKSVAEIGAEHPLKAEGAFLPNLSRQLTDLESSLAAPRG